jgi:hypothetical protein
MSISKCIVRLKNCHNTEHSIEVYAESLYEAVLDRLNRPRRLLGSETKNYPAKVVGLQVVVNLAYPSSMR